MDRTEIALAASLAGLAIAVGIGTVYVLEPSAPLSPRASSAAPSAPAPTTLAPSPTAAPTATAVATSTTSPMPSTSTPPSITRSPAPTQTAPPAAAAPKTAPPAPTIAATPITYTVQRGDTLGRIARDHGVTVAAILGSNRIRDPNSLTIGQVLRIPTPAPGR